MGYNDGMSDPCPDPKLLEAHIAGEVRGHQAIQLDQHLSECDRCVQTIQGLDADRDAVDRVIHRAKKYRPGSATIQLKQTAAQPRAVKMAAGRLEIDFLHPPEQDDEIGRLGGYRVLQVIGVGGMGVVFRAEDPDLERMVALKAMKPSALATESAKERFLREAKATAAIEHDNIVSIYQVGQDGEIPFIAMRYLQGETLDDVLSRKNLRGEPVRMSQLQTVAISREIAEGLSAAHEHGLIHRDIKPENIWLEEKSGRVKILDFGLARPLHDDARLTQRGTLVGTPRYMAPEQAAGLDVDYRCDLFSLGIVIYQMLSGKPPFRGKSLSETLKQISKSQYTPIRKLCSNVDKDLAALVAKLLSREPAARPESAADVSHALKKIDRNLRAGDRKHDKRNWRGSNEPTDVDRTSAKIWIAIGVVAVVIVIAWFTGAFAGAR